MLCWLLLTPPLIGGDEGSDRLTIFFTGFVQGNFEPCGCKAGPAGGLARRAGFIQNYRRQEAGRVIHVDLGNYFKPVGPDSRVINELMLETLPAVPVDILNLASEDLFFWKTLSRAQLGKTWVISTNLRPPRGLPVPPRFATVELTGTASRQQPVRVSFLALSDPLRVKPNSGFRALNPAETIRKIKPEVMKGADFLVILADLSRHEAASLALDHPEIRAILLAEKTFLPEPPRRVNQAVIVSAIEQGGHLGKLVLELNAEGRIASTATDTIELKDVAEDPKILRRQMELAERLR